MSATGFRRAVRTLLDSEGKGVTGCFVFIAVLALSAIIGARIVPVIYSVKSFETDVKTEVSRAGAQFYADEVLLNNLLDLARRNELRIKRENIKLERFAGQVFVTIHYSTLVDFIVVERNMNFDIKASSFIGRL
jgi:hypothetical protein